MRNLKKFLALVLAVMMAASLMVTANATIDTDAAVTDKDSITEEFKEAVAVLNGLGIITGYEDGTFRPDKNISRQETTALVYRLHSGDVKDTKNDLYSTADNIKQFTDVNREGGQKWSAGYIGYCANQGIIKGVSDTRFAPTHEVTGYQVLAMVLRAIGYGQNKEYEGTGWQTRVATTATQLDLLKNINNTNYSATLSASASRELVAEIIFQAALQPTVTYTAGLGYVKTGSSLVGGTQGSLSTKNFKLNYTPYRTIDDWGRPGYYWFQDTKGDGKAVLSGSGKNVVATIMPNPEKEYTWAIDECDLAHDLGIKTEATFDLFVNDETPITNNYLVVATDTVTKVGGQGRLTQVYRNLYNGKGSQLANRVVMVDTYLAKVTKVTAAVLDTAGHVMVPAKLDLVVYDGVDGTSGAYAAPGSTQANAGTAKTISKAAGDATNWTYAVGDMLLLNAKTLKGFPATSVNKDHTTGEPAKNKAAFEDNAMFAVLRSGGNKTTWADYNHTLSEGENVEILGKAESKIAKQGTVYYNQNKHNVDGTDIADAMLLYKDEADVNTTADWAWYFDQYGNVIGIDVLPNTVQYGVITDLWASFGQGTSSTDGTEKIMANVTLANGEKTTIEVSKFLVSGVTTKPDKDNVGGGKLQATNPATAMTSGNVVDLIPVYDYNSTANVMRAVGEWDGANEPAYWAYSYLHVAPVASVNAANDTNNWGSTQDKSYGIIIDNMFKFTSNNDGTYTAIEVAGNGTNGAAGFDGLYNIKTHTATTATENRLFKNLGYVTVNSGGSAAAVWVNNNTKIMIYNPATKAITCYNGVNELPGDVAIAASDSGSDNKNYEVDWADTNGDGRADYLYLAGTIEGSVTYGLFYYNGGSAQWNNTDKTGSIVGYLNGEAATISFQGDNGKAMFEQLMAAVPNYKARLFALQLSGGIVSNVMVNDADNAAWVKFTDGKENKVVYDAGTLTGVKTGPDFSNSYPEGQDFVVGAKGGNNYTENTRVRCIYDQNSSVAGEGNVWYDRATGVVHFTANDGWPADFTITDNTKIVGQLDYLGYSATENKWISDVTIVYEPSGINAITEIYITTEPTNTPGIDGNASYLTNIVLSNLGHDGTSGWTLDIAAADSTVALTCGSDYDRAVVRIKNVDGATVYTKSFNGSTPATDIGAGATVTLAATDLNYANLPAGSIFDVTVTYYNGYGTSNQVVVAQGSARLVRG